MLRTKLTEGIYFTVIPDDKFKTTRISFNIITKLSDATAAVNGIVPFLLRRGSKNYPSFIELNKKLSELYGASIYSDVKKIGHSQVLGLSLQAINNQFALYDEDIIKESTDLLMDLILAPKIEGGEFDNLDLEIERKALIELVESEINDKRSYAINQMEKEMYKDTAYAIDRFGKVDDIKEITASCAADAYKDILKSGQIEIIYIGAEDQAKSALEMFKTRCESIDREFLQTVKEIPYTAKDEVIRAEEKLNITQGKMVLGFSAQSENADAMRLGIAIYGGTPTSKLFENVREKLSLCYYCAARYDKLVGTMIVDCGVMEENIEKAEAEILVQLDAMKAGNFTDEDIKNAKLALINSYKSVYDSLLATEVWYLARIYLDEVISPEEYSEVISKITKDQIVKAVSEIKLQTAYYLKGI